jgi:hypothetical protein
MRFFFTTDEVLETFETTAADEEWAESVDIPGRTLSGLG